MTKLAEKLKFAAAGLAHGHIYQMCAGLIGAGAELVYVYDDDESLIAEFLKKFPTVKRAKSEADILKDDTISLVVSAAIPSERAPLGIRAMKSGKNFLSAKAPVVSFAQLRSVKKAVKQTGRKFFVYYSERVASEAAVYAEKAIASGKIGRVLNVTMLAPHKLGDRPLWFFDRKKTGGILIDVGSHQFEQFLTFTGNERAKVVSANTANFAHKTYSGFDDFGDAYLLGANGATGYVRVDWFTPGGLPVFGDGKAVILGSEGYIELRKYIDVGSDDSEVVIISTKAGTEKFSMKNKAEKPFFSAVISDCLHGTETAMRQEHALYTMELALKAQKKAKRGIER